MRTHALLVLALAACGAPAAAPSASPLEPPTAAPAPGGAPPTVARTADELRATGLPAITADGSAVVFAQRLSDGLRGLPNLTLFVKSRDDRARAEHVVLAVAEADQLLADATGANPALDARVTAANRWLADLHARAALVPMTAVGPATPTLGQRRIARGELVITWDRDRLQIRDGGRVLVERATPAAWHVEPYTIGTGQTCEHPAYLAGAHVDRARRVALVRIVYAAPSDLCGEPSDQLHVVAW